MRDFLLCANKLMKKKSVITAVEYERADDEADDIIMSLSNYALHIHNLYSWHRKVDEINFLHICFFLISL